MTVSFDIPNHSDLIVLQLCGDFRLSVQHAQSCCFLADLVNLVEVAQILKNMANFGLWAFVKKTRKLLQVRLTVAKKSVLLFVDKDLGAEKLFSVLLLGFIDVEIEEEEVGWASGAEEVHDSFEGNFLIRGNELLFFYVEGFDDHLLGVFIEFGLIDD